MSDDNNKKPAHIIQNPEIIECEYSVFRRGYVHAYINLDRRIFYWQDSNQWNKNYVRSLNELKVESVRKILQRVPYQPVLQQNDVERQVSEACPFYWKITICGKDRVNTYEGNDPGDEFLRKFMALIEETSDLTLFW
ncbi:MAG TPA: hypothetical protein GXZ81_03985 [Fastidiosipila sp.]|jgi:hypothetical protein|nr:hypothetical protein [Eubacteriales bacterium]MDD3611195.1 hypothetical protein [Eubacteriales bacterium]HHU04161.1 hypothetical protein [Fastidiosipila sp.]